MGSGFFGVPSMGNEKSSSSSSSSRKNKKGGGGGPEKPKQPQRGLGVAQLEQIRLRSQIACGFTPPSVIQEDIMRVQGGVGPYGVVPQSSTSYANYSQSSPSTSSNYGHHPNFMLAFGEENLRYQESHPSTAFRWNPNSTGILDTSSTYRQSSMPSMATYFEDPRRGRLDLMRSSSQNSESSDHEEVDLELRLSI